MGVKEFSEFKDELELELGEMSNLESQGGVNFYGQWINSAYMTITTMNKSWKMKKNLYFPELEVSSTATTSDGQATVNTPSNCMIVRWVWDSTSDVKLDRIGMDEYVRRTGRADTSSEGAPTQYVRHGSYLYLYPTPDDSYVLYIYHRKRPTELSADDDKTLIGAEWDEPILRMAKVLALRKLNQYDHAKQEKDFLDEMVAGIAGIYDQEQLDRNQTLIPHPGYAQNDNEY